MNIRNCVKGDLSSVIKLIQLTNLYWEVSDTEAACDKKLQHDPESILVLEEDNKIIGAVFFIYDPWISTMWHLVIQPEYQGRHLASFLADEAERRLKARGTTSIVGYVLPTNTRSLRFLKRRGYEIWTNDLVTPVAKILK